MQRASGYPDIHYNAFSSMYGASYPALCLPRIARPFVNRHDVIVGVRGPFLLLSRKSVNEEDEDSAKRDACLTRTGLLNIIAHEGD